MSVTAPGVDQVVRDLVQAMVAGGDGDPPVAAWAEQLGRVARATPFAEGDVIVQHHAVADSLHFLVQGDLRYQHLVTDPGAGEVISHETMPWMALGWTGLHFRRYRVTITAASDGVLLTIPLAAWRRLASEAPTLLATLAQFVFRTSVGMLWAARHREPGDPWETPGTVAGLEPIEGWEPAALRELFDQSDAFSGLPAGCRAWLAGHTRLYRAEGGVRVLEEGQASTGLWLLNVGRVALRFTVSGPDGPQDAIRYAVRPGKVLCWSATSTPVPAPYEVATTRRTTLAFVPRAALAALLDEHPVWAAGVFQQQIWQLRNYLVSTRTSVADGPGDGGIHALAHLIEDSKPLLPVNSTLYGVPYLLRNYLTREEGFGRLYRTHFGGTADERVVASLGLDIVRELERSHRFFVGLQATYAAVVRNRALEPRQLRVVSSRYFRDALSHVPWAIDGWEHLPDDPNCILIYNHMAYAEDSILPNGFLFNPDSHFMSSMIQEPKYGDSIRISRSNDATEYWRADYYDRLGHVSVTTPQSGWRPETQAEKQRRKQRFFEDCQAILASGQPFSIAPEGNITDEESSTEQSPAPFKAGAFVMSGQLPSRPKLVPVAFANFDKPAYEAVFSCVIKPAFTMEERGVDVDDRDALASFLAEYRQEFRGHVEDAISLGHRVAAPDADLTGIRTNIGHVDAVHDEFELDVRALEQRGAAPGAPRAATVFYGSSTFRLWEDLADDLDLSDAVNLSFGGSTFEACRLYFDRLVMPYRPHRLVVYCGENDLSRGASADFVSEQFRQFADKVGSFLPGAPCWFVSIKPSPDRGPFLEEIRRTNTRIAAEIAERDQWRYVDWFSYMLDGDGRANARLFHPDQIHVNLAGYGILGGLLRQELAGSR